MSEVRVPQNASFAIIESHFTDHSFVQNQIDSTDKFFNETIEEIIRNIPDVVARDKHKKAMRYFRYGKTMIERMRPPGFIDSTREEDVTPQECRLRDLSYVCHLYVNVHESIRYDSGKVENKPADKVELGDIPIMVKSGNCILNGLDKEELIKKGECPYDEGGYFILSGKERAIVAQERLSYNQLFVFKDKSALKAEIRCHCEDTDQQSTIHLKYAVSKKQGPGIKVVIPHIHESKGVLLFAVFLALGIPTKEEAIRMILYPSYDDIEMRDKLEGSISESTTITNREEAIAYLTQYVKPRVTNTAQAGNFSNTSGQLTSAESRKAWMKAWLIHILDRELFPHLGQTKSFDASKANVFSSEFQEYITSGEFTKRCTQKAWFLAYSVKRLIRVALNRDKPSDRDHMAHKRLNLSGPLLAQLFKKKMHAQHNSMVKLLMKHINQNKEVKVSGVMKTVDVTKGLAFSLKTGNWTGTKTNPTNSSKNQGVSQVLNRMNYISPKSHLRRTSASDTNLSVVRMLHNTQYGICCPR
jgi:DNA-directed RNA polymerase II subunit RPB2